MEEDRVTVRAARAGGELSGNKEKKDILEARWGNESKKNEVSKYLW